MKQKPVVLLATAVNDVSAAVDYYLREAGHAVTMAFIAELEKTYGSIGRRPALGSSRYGHALDIPGLRSRKLTKYPYLVFYVELPEQVDVWRVLHTRRDIPSSFAGPAVQ